MALPNQPWTTSYPGAQDTVGSEQPDLTPDTTPGAGDGHRVLVSHMHSLRDKLQEVAVKLGDGSNLPAGSVGAKVAALESAPPAHASTHDAGGADAMAIDAAAGTGSLRTLGATATSACAGDDARLSDARTPTSHAASHQNGGADEVSIAGLSGKAADDQNADSIRTTTGPTLLAVGAIADGEYLRRSGATCVGGPGGSPSPLTTKGDVYTYDTGDQRLPVGADGQVLTADSGAATGLAWQDAAGGLAPPVGSTVKYYIDGTAGSDLNDGSDWANAFATFDHLWNNVLPVAVRDRYLVEFRNAGAISDAGPNGGYHADKIFMGPNAGLAIMGEQGLTATPFADTVGFFGATANYIPLTTGGLTAEAEIGKWVRFTSGAASGDIRQITQNSAGSFWLGADLSAVPASGDTFEYVEPDQAIEGDFAISVQAESGGYGVKFDYLKHTAGVAGDMIKVYGVDVDFRNVYLANGTWCEGDMQGVGAKTYNAKPEPLVPATGDDDGASVLLCGLSHSVTNDGNQYITGYVVEEIASFSSKTFAIVKCTVTGEIGGASHTPVCYGTAHGAQGVVGTLIADTNFHGGQLDNFLSTGLYTAASTDAVRIQRSKVKWAPAVANVQGVGNFKRYGVYLDNAQLLIDSSTVGLGGTGWAGSSAGIMARWGSQVRLTSTFVNSLGGASQAEVYSGTATWVGIQGGTALVDPVEFCVFSVDDMWADGWD